MPRAIVADLITRYGEAELIQLTDRTHPPSRVINEAVALQALTDASAEVSSYVLVRWPAGVSTTPALVEAECILARHRLHRTPTDAVIAEAARIRAWLRDLADGDAAVDPSPDDGGTTVVSGQAQLVGPDRMFTLDRMRGL